MAHVNKFEIEMFAKRAAQELLEHGRDLNDSVFEIACVNDLNREQVRRVVEAANTIANGELVKRAKVRGEDPRVSFTLADSTQVFTRITAERPEAKLAREREATKLAGMFRVKDKPEPPVFEKQAEATAPRLSVMSGPELAAAYIRGTDVGDQVFTLGQISDACEDIVRCHDAAREKWARLAEAENAVLQALAADVERELHAGTSPATVKAAMARADVGEWILSIASKTVDDKARELGRDDGENKIAATTMVDMREPVFVDLAALLLVDAERLPVLEVSDKIAAAYARAHDDLLRARAQGPGKVAALNMAAVHRGVGHVKGVGGGAIKAIGVGLGAMEAKKRAEDATRRLKRMQQTPTVLPMKMAAEKLASSGLGVTKTLDGVLRPKQLLGIGLGAAVAGVGLLGAEKAIDTVSDRVGDIFERRKRNRLWEKLLEREPALKQNPRAREVFDMVLTYAPALGDHPMAIGDFLKRQLQYPVSGVEFLNALAKLQKDIADARRRSPNSLTAGIGTAVTTAQGQWIKGM